MKISPFLCLTEPIQQAGIFSCIILLQPATAGTAKYDKGINYRELQEDAGHERGGCNVDSLQRH